MCPPLEWSFESDRCSALRAAVDPAPASQPLRPSHQILQSMSQPEAFIDAEADPVVLHRELQLAVAARDRHLHPLRPGVPPHVVERLLE
jgi:hypothetical protein